MSRLDRGSAPAPRADQVPGVLPLRPRALPVGDHPGEQAFAEFWADTYPRVRQVIALRTREPIDADDVASRIFVAIWTRYFEGGRPVDRVHMERVAFGMVSPAHADHRRFMSKASARFGKFTRQLHRSAQGWMDPERALERSTLVSAIDEVLDALPARTALAYRLAECGWKYHEIGPAIGTGRSMVAEHLTVARRAVRDNLERRGFAPHKSGRDT